MKIGLLLFLLTSLASYLLLYPEYAKKYSMLLVTNVLNKNELPQNFHVTPFKTSGSGQFSEQGFKEIRKKIPPEFFLLVVDLREEMHGFLNGMGISWFANHNWYNIGKTTEQIIEEERLAIERLSQKRWTLLFYDRQFPLPSLINNVSTEEAYVTMANSGYYRLTVSDHRAPLDPQIDRFIDLVKTLPTHVWLHIHCSAGRGRTNTFLAMHDMMLNASKDSLERILGRQYDLGGYDLLSLPQEKWKRPHIKKRVEFIKLFYQYCKEVPDFTLSWSKWIDKNINH